MEDYVTLERSDDVMIVRFDRQGAVSYTHLTLPTKA